MVDASFAELTGDAEPQCQLLWGPAHCWRILHRSRRKPFDYGLALSSSGHALEQSGLPHACGWSSRHRISGFWLNASSSSVVTMRNQMNLGPTPTRCPSRSQRDALARRTCSRKVACLSWISASTASAWSRRACIPSTIACFSRT